MSWLKKYLPGGGGDSPSSPFIVGSDKWMGSTAQHKGEKADPAVLPRPTEEKDDEDDDDESSPQPEIARSKSFAPPPEEVPEELPRSASLSNSKKSMYPKIREQAPAQDNPPSSPSSSLYPKIYEGRPEEELHDADADDTKAPLDPREECLVTIPNAIVHLVEENQSPHLATGHFSIVRIAQKGNGIVVLVRVGENLHWPLMMDVPTVKLDPTHYFFALPVPSSIDAFGSGNFEADAETNGLETLNYGVTFPDAKKYEKQLQSLDEFLALYSSFSTPTLVQGDQQQEALTQKTKELALGEKEKQTGSSGQGAVLVDKHGGKVVPADVLSSDGKQVVATEENQAAFWTTMAPNVDDYGSSAARAIATGSGHMIRGIFWVRDSAVIRLESGTIYLKGKINAGENPRPIGPKTMKNLKRVRKVSRGTESLAKGVLKGVVTTAGFVSGTMIKSSLGTRVFKLMPGEVALVSLDAFAKLLDAMEKATTDVLQSTSLMTENVVAHKFGVDAGQVTRETLATAGHVVATAWTITKLRKALNPKEGVKPTKAGMVKGLAKNVIRGK